MESNGINWVLFDRSHIDRMVQKGYLRPVPKIEYEALRGVEKKAISQQEELNRLHGGINHYFSRLKVLKHMKLRRFLSVFGDERKRLNNKIENAKEDYEAYCGAARGLSNQRCIDLTFLRILESCIETPYGIYKVLSRKGERALAKLGDQSSTVDYVI